jgi:Leucine-rich repeat (LRR) protein
MISINTVSMIFASFFQDYNQLGDSLTSGRFDNLNTLGTLKLRGNNITKPPWEALGALQSLRILHLDDNMLVNLTRKSFGRLPVVAILGLSGNNINNISMNAFEGLLQLTDLDLSRNNLSYVPPGAFQSLVAVRKINLSHNKLEYLQNKTHGLFDDCLSIREVCYKRQNFFSLNKTHFCLSRSI